MNRDNTLVFLLVLVTIVGALSRDAEASQVAAPEQPAAEDCVSAEDCFTAAAWPKERLGNVLTRDQVVALKLERLRQVMERFPASLWAKRAGLLSGVIMIERNPAAAMAYLRTAQRDFPILDDYVRFWIGEALLHLGDAKEAATMFETIPQADPDSNLFNQVALRAGEAWYQASSCPEAISWLVKAVSLNEKEPQVAQAWLRLASCQMRINQTADAREALKQLWIKFPHTKEAQEAEVLLRTATEGGPWVPQPDDHYARAQAFLGQAFYQEAIEELKQFLAKDPSSSHRGEARLKLGIAQVRLKLYDQARETFQGLTAEQGAQSDDATVWLARVYLRQGLGEKLVDLSRGSSKRPLSPEQKGQIHLFAGIWLEDQGRYDDAIAKYREVATSGEPASQQAEARWREGWAFYRTARYEEATAVWQHIINLRDSDFEPQALYWVARAYSQTGNQKSREMFQLLCQRYPYTYYCQLARAQTPLPFSAPGDGEGVPTPPVSAQALSDSTAAAPSAKAGITQQPAYRRAVELRALGLEQEAATELAALTDHYSRDPDVLMALSMMLNDVGAYHHALRLVRVRFHDRLERTGGTVAAGLWSAAYPTGLIPTIKKQATAGVDPYLVAAIIREESQYDRRAVSRAGAIGLMQVMPATANAVAERHHFPGVVREDLFDQETNIRIGVRYVEQLLAHFSGNVVQAVAAYNAGPMVVGKWASEHRGRSEDEFVELIPYQETRQYVKRVLRSYKEYVRLARQSGPVS